MSDEVKKIFETKAREAARAGDLFLRALCGDESETRAVGKKLAVQAAKEQGRPDLAKVLDAEFEEEDT